MKFVRMKGISMNRSSPVDCDHHGHLDVLLAGTHSVVQWLVHRAGECVLVMANKK